MAQITVRGAAAAHLPPDEATLTVVVHAEVRGDEAAAISAAATAADAADAVIESHRPDLVVGVQASSLATSPRYEHDPTHGRRLTGHLASRRTVLVCAADADGLERMIGELAPIQDLRLAGPDWKVRDDATGWVEVRSAAAADARRRAEAYASGLGRTVGDVIWIAEPGLRAGGSDVSPPLGTPRMMAAAATGGGQEMESPRTVRLSAERVPVSVTVEVAFDLR